jgi:hypothetical protein
MTCFWTDLVGTTQTGCSEDTLRLAVNSTALESPSVTAVSAIASAFLATFSGTVFNVSDNPGNVSLMIDAASGGDSAAIGWSSGATYNNIATFDWTAASSLTIGFSSQAGRYITTYAEFIASGSLTVAGCWRITYNSCGSPLSVANVTTDSSAGASAAIVGGLLEVSPPSAWGSTGSSLIDHVMRITGTILGEDGTSAAVDFYLFGSYNGCF